MSKIIERKESQHLIDVEENKVVFDCGHEIHEVIVHIGGTQFNFSRHLNNDNTVSKNKYVKVHDLGKTEMTIFDKVSKKLSKTNHTEWTDIKVVSE
tara:strand:- start:336 stop:623 length:288 start_codon:yes stop_codon:yes gene_type:complete